MSAPRNGDRVRVRTVTGETTDCVLAADVDLDTEVVRDGAGRRITNGYADRVVAEVLEQRASRGRPSLSGEGGSRSPQVTFRLSPALQEKVERRAQAEGKRVSDVAREALERYVG